MPSLPFSLPNNKVASFSPCSKSREKFVWDYMMRFFIETLTILICFFFQVLNANKNTYVPEKNELDPPIVASRVRILPYSDHLRTVCLRVELHGCNYTGKHILWNEVQYYWQKIWQKTMSLVFMNWYLYCSMKEKKIKFGGNVRHQEVKKPLVTADGYQNLSN